MDGGRTLMVGGSWMVGGPSEAAWALVACVALAPSWGSPGHETAAGPARWGPRGHEMAAHAALATLPDAIPAFFRDAADELVYLDPEPDRWRSSELVEMNRAWAFDHYVNLEIVPDDALEVSDRYAYLRALGEAGLEEPSRDAGLLLFRIVELYQRLVTEWRLWREESDPRRRRWIEARIVFDAGVLGHYVTDGAQPHHTTIHFDGWAAGAPNPEGYTRERGFHARFESEFVDAHLTRRAVESRVRPRARSLAGPVRDSVLGFLRDSHAALETLYRVDRDVGFAPDAAPAPRAEAFAAGRLAAGAEMLAALWWTAYLEGRGER